MQAGGIEWRGAIFHFIIFFLCSLFQKKETKIGIDQFLEENDVIVTIYFTFKTEHFLILL